MPRQVVFRGRKIEVALDTLVLPTGQTVQRDVVAHPGAVAVVAMVDAERVCLLRNQRFVVNDTLLERPAGTLEPGEDPQRAAARELEEETGYRAGRWRKLAEFFASPGVLTEVIHLFVAQDLTAGEARPEPEEELRPEVVPWKQAVAWALDGTVRDAKTLAGLLLWDRLRGK
jgi:ADP-ribose pyrophosphatase